MAQHLKIVFNPFTGKFDYVNSAQTTIPEFEGSDPVSPAPEDTWVLHAGYAAVGSPIGLLLALTHADIKTGKYFLSYYTLENTIKRVELT